METPVAARAMKTPGTWREIERRLAARRAALNAEIAAYPAPIPACDVQFNHLLEMRSGINRELKRLDEMARAGGETGGDAAAIRRFVNGCEFLPCVNGDEKT